MQTGTDTPQLTYFDKYRGQCTVNADHIQTVLQTGTGAGLAMLTITITIPNNAIHMALLVVVDQVLLQELRHQLQLG